MSTVAQMYADLRADVGQDKTASDEGQATDQTADQAVVMDADYFNKLAGGEEAHVAHLEGIVKEAAEAGYTEEQINDSISEVAADAGVDLDALFGEGDGGTEKVAGEGDGGTDLVPADGDALEGEIVDEFEMQKIASFNDGGNQAIEDIFETNEMIKEGEVTPEDLAEYYLGQSFGQGYYEKRAELEEAIEKIAMAKKKDKLKKYMAGGAMGAAAAGGAGAAHAQGMIPGTMRGRGRRVLKAEMGEHMGKMKAKGVRGAISNIVKTYGKVK